jgi:hypothetical protein
MLSSTLANFGSSSGAWDTEHGIILDDLMSALKHESHSAEVSEGGPALFDVRPVEQLEAIGVWNGAEPSNRTGGAAVEEQVTAAAFLHVVSRELSGDFGKRLVGFDHAEQCADFALRTRGSMNQPIRFVAEW